MEGMMQSPIWMKYRKRKNFISNVSIGITELEEKFGGVLGKRSFPKTPPKNPYPVFTLLY
jgi:hypothetical protein